jgi:hypothetical protein
MPSSAVFTVQHDEDFYLPMWLKYYEENFDAQDIYVVSHNCTHLTKDILEDAEARGINVERVNTNEIFNHAWLTDLVHSYQRKLLENYDYVLFVDCDEIVAPSNQSLKNFIKNASEAAYRCFGYEVIVDGIVRNPNYDKTLITSIPLNYVYGYHTATPEFTVTDSLHLYHLHRLNYEKSWQRNLRLAEKKWDRQAIAGGFSIQNQLTTKQQFDNFFYSGKENAVAYTETLTKILAILQEPI